MKNKLKKYAAIGTIAIMGLLLANTAVEKTVTLISDIDTSCVTVYSGGEKTVGRNDADYTLFEEYGSDAEIYGCIEDGYFSTSVIEKILNDGYCLGYVDQLKAEGWIPQDFTPAGSKPSSTTQTETKTETPADDQTVPETKEQPKTEIKTETKTETEAEPTQEEIDAAWEETERVEATCTEDGKIVYNNSVTGDTKEESIPASGHDYEVTDTTEAACTEDGKNTYTCKVCGDSYEEAIPATGHTEGEWKVTKEAGLFSTGSKEVTCEKCGEVLDTEEIPQTCPLPLAAVIGIVVAVVVIIGVIVVLVRRRKNI